MICLLIVKTKRWQSFILDFGHRVHRESMHLPMTGQAENSWIVPPPNLICKVINHLQLCNAEGVLVVPKWRSALFWPMLWDENRKYYAYFVKSLVEYEKPKNFFKPGSDKNSIFACNAFQSNVLVLKVSFKY